MVPSLLVRGMLVGLLAGLLGFGFARIAGEPQVVSAIAFESAQEAADHDHADAEETAAAPAEEHEHDEVSRQVQSTWGLLTGTLVAGVALGGLFGLLYAFGRGRVGPLSARPLAMALAAGSFVAVYLVPYVKYPPNPPAVGNPDTIGRRTVLYFALILISIAIVAVAVIVRRRALPRYGEWNATLIAVGAFLALNVIAFAAMPTVDETPAGFPADLLWRFRLASLGIQLVMWTTIGVVFGALSHRADTRDGFVEQPVLTHS